MKSTGNRHYLIFSIVVILIGCSPSEHVNNNIQIEITKHHVNVWLNLMPSMSPGTFHLTGDITLNNDSQIKLDSLSLMKIIVYADSEEVYIIKPVFKPKSKDENYSLSSGSNKEFIFKTEKGLKIKEKLIDYEMIDLKLELQSHMGKQSFVINNIKVERAY